MKKILAILLSCTLVMTGCGQKKENVSAETTEETTAEAVAETVTETTAPAEIKDSNEHESFATEQQQDKATYDEDALVEDPEPADSKSEPREYSFTSLNDPELLTYYEKAIYTEVSGQLGREYAVQNVSTAYISKEYIEELTYNSQSNIFFGYTLSDIDAEFQGTKYVFTLGEDGETTVVPFEAYDDTYEKVLKNVAIGTGVILVSVTVSAVTAGAGAPAVSMIFAASAKSGAVFAASSGAISTVITGAVTGIRTGDFNEAIKAGALAGSESFKWGAVSGTVLGGASELIMLKTAAKGGLTLNEAATVIKESGLPASVVKDFHSMDDYYKLVESLKAGKLAIQDVGAICTSTGYPLEVVKRFGSYEESAIYYEQAGLYGETVNGQAALIRHIDLTYESELAGHTVTNLERMKMGYAAIDPVTGKAFQLHHIGQSVDSPLAILTQFEHTGGGNNAILHDLSIADGEGVHSLLTSVEWTTQKEEFWIALAEIIG